MKTGDKELLILGAIGLILLWLIWDRSPAAPVQLASGSPWGNNGDPYQWVNPGFQNPTGWGPSNVNLNVTGNPISGLAPYMPLFGFVGVDTTQLYQ